MPFDDGLGAGTGEGLQEGLFIANTAQAISTGGSVFYHSFQDLTTDAEDYLNDTSATRITMYAEETAGGLQWVLSYAPDSAVVYARSVTSSPATTLASLPATAIKAAAAPLPANSVSFDFPVPSVMTEGTWVFNAEVTIGGRVDVTSGIVVVVKPALGT
jgi:hypothetical protein